MANNKPFKVKNGLHATRYLQTVGSSTAVAGGQTIDLSTGQHFSFTQTGPTTRTHIVTVQSTGSGNRYYVDGVLQQQLYLQEGKTYRFNQSDSSNSNHPLRFSTTANGSHGGGSEYTTGVTTAGTPGNSGAYTEITVAAGAPTLYYYCTNHNLMGGTAYTPSSGTISLSITVSNPGVGNRYYIDTAGPAPTISLAEGTTIRFNQSDSSNSNHPLRFSITSNGTHGGGSEYTTGVTTYGTPGNSGAYTEITIAAGAPTLYYYCTNHSNMGGTVFTPSTGETMNVSFINPPGSGKALAFILDIQASETAIAWPASVKWNQRAPIISSGKESYAFLTIDGGTTYYGKKIAEGIA